MTVAELIELLRQFPQTDCVSIDLTKKGGGYLTGDVRHLDHPYGQTLYLCADEV